MQIQQEVIGPKEAQELLGKNSDNRPLNNSHVQFLADQIRANAWQLTGDPIKISQSGKLLDGQHRLSAIVRAKMNVDIFIARDVPEAVFTVLDTGKNRTGRDVLHIDGLKSPTAQAALARALMTYYFSKTGQKSRTFTNQEVLEYCKKNDLLTAVNIGTALEAKGSMLKRSIISIAYFILTAVDKKTGHDFVQQLCLGTDMKEGDPMYLLYSKLRKAVLGGYAPGKWETVALIIKTWNLIRTGSPLPSIIIYNPARESFPIAA